MRASDFVDALGADYFVGVPDSQLKYLCDYLLDRYGLDSRHHVIAANEGNCVGLAAGYHLATGRTPVVYMQNSGEGNAVNPMLSLSSPDVYAIPTIFVIGWRGEPGVKDEPQHVHQGKLTVDLLDLMGIDSFTVRADSSVEDVKSAMSAFRARLAEGGSVAFVVCKNAIEGESSWSQENGFAFKREDAVNLIIGKTGTDPIVSTTGKISRELFEAREALGQGHGKDFLTVGSMGHASSIAMGIAAQLPGKRIWCLDGDGAVLMHMGALAHASEAGLANFRHVVLNNRSHESVGGYPTVGAVDLPAIAQACGYPRVYSVNTPEELGEVLDAERADASGPSFIEVKCAVGSRSDLGRPTTSPQDNKAAFMSALKA